MLYRLLLASFFYILCHQHTGAQVPAAIITQDDVMQPGYEVYLVHDSLASQSIVNQILTKVGNDQVWDFSLLHNHHTDTLQFVETDITLYEKEFLNATVCAVKVEDGKDFFLENNIEGLFLSGHVNDAFMANSYVVKRIPPLQLIRYPCTYLDTLSSYSSITEIAYYGQYIMNGQDSCFADSIKVISTITATTTIDAYGTLTTPNNLLNAIRQNSSKYLIEYTYNYVQGLGWLLNNTRYDTAYYLKWWAENAQYPVVECNYIPHRNSIAHLKFSSFRFIGEGSSVNNINPISIQLFPNPAKETIELKNVSNKGEIKIYDALGNLLVNQKLIPHPSSTIISIEKLSIGIYYYAIFDSQNQCSNKGKLLITR